MPPFSKKRVAELDAKLPELIEEQGLTHVEAGKILGVSRDWIGSACKRLGLETASTGPRRGERHPEWNGGRILHGRYWYIYSPDHPNATQKGYVAEHRLAMERKLGRYLSRSEVVHHKNANPEDNRLENLEVFQTNAEHLRHELTGRRPNWTAEGFSRMKEAAQRKSIRARQARGGRRRTQTNQKA